LRLRANDTLLEKGENDKGENEEKKNTHTTMSAQQYLFLSVVGEKVAAKDHLKVWHV
jgi:hypothetical protein